MKMFLLRLLTGNDYDMYEARVRPWSKAKKGKIILNWLGGGDSIPTRSPQFEAELIDDGNGFDITFSDLEQIRLRYDQASALRKLLHLEDPETRLEKYELKRSKK